MVPTCPILLWCLAFQVPPAGPAVQQAPLTPAVQYAELTIDGPIGEGERSNPRYVARALSWVKAAGIRDVVIRIDTPGGEVAAAKAMQKCILDHQPDIRFHARITNCISAGIWLAFACDDIWMEDSAAFGGAVAFSQSSSTGAIEVDAKINSILSAEIAAVAKSHGHSPEAVAAMTVMNAQLWLIPGSNVKPALSASAPSNGSDPSARCLDTPETVLTATTSVAVDAGIARLWSEAIPLQEGWGTANSFPLAMREIDRVFKDKSPRGEFLATGPADDLHSIVIELGQANVAKPRRGEIQGSKWPKIRRLIESAYANDPLGTPVATGPSQSRLDAFRKRRKLVEANWKELVTSIAWLRKDYSVPALGHLPPPTLTALWDKHERLIAAERPIAKPSSP